MLIIKEFDIEYIEDFMKLEITKSQEKFFHFYLDEIVKSFRKFTSVYLYIIYHDLLAIGLAYFK